MKYEEFKVKLTGTSPILGGSPLRKDIYRDYIVAKAETDAEKAMAKDDEKNIIDSDDKGITGFYRDLNGNLILKGYQIKGFLKEASKALKSSINIARSASKIDNLCLF